MLLLAVRLSIYRLLYTEAASSLVTGADLVWNVVEMFNRVRAEVNTITNRPNQVYNRLNFDFLQPGLSLGFFTTLIIEPTNTV